MSEIAQRVLEVGREFFANYRSEIEAVGPRHRNVARWLHDYGWGIDALALDAYLAPEKSRRRIPFSQESA